MLLWLAKQRGTATVGKLLLWSFSVAKSKEEKDHGWKSRNRRALSQHLVIQLTLSRYFHSLEGTKKWRRVFLWNIAVKSGRALF